MVRSSPLHEQPILASRTATVDAHGTAGVDGILLEEISVLAPALDCGDVSEADTCSRPCGEDGASEIGNELCEVCRLPGGGGEQGTILA